MKINLWKCTTIALAAALAFVTTTHLREAKAGDQPQPHMQAALQLLEAADTHLESATADKGGHRVKARENTKKAIEEVKAGIEFDKKNDGGANENKRK